MKWAQITAILVLLFTTALARRAPELKVGPVHLDYTKAQLAKVVKPPLLKQTILNWESWYFVSPDKLRPFPLGDLWEPVYLIDFRKDGSIDRVIGRIATIRGITIEFADTQEKVRKLLGPPTKISTNDSMEIYYYDASDRKSCLGISFGKPGLGISMIILHSRTGRS